MEAKKSLDASIEPRHFAVEYLGVTVLNAEKVRLQLSHGILPWNTLRLGSHRDQGRLASIEPRHFAVEYHACGKELQKSLFVLQLSHGILPWNTGLVRGGYGPCWRLQLSHGILPWNTWALLYERHALMRFN